MKNKGVSLIEVVIIIIILIMIAVFSVLATRNTSVQAEATALYIEMKSLRTSVLSIKADYDIGVINSIDSGVYYNSGLPSSAIIYGLDEATMYSQQVVENLMLDELKRTYIVDFSTGEVELNTPVSLGEYRIRTFEDIETIIESGAI